MKALLAIFITVCLLAATCVASVLIHFNLIWMLVVMTSLWAAIDSKKVELNRYSTSASCRPLPLFFICCLLWIIFFPVYLRARFKIKDGTAVLKTQLPADAALATRFLHNFQRFIPCLIEWSAIGIIMLITLIIGIALFCVEEGWRGPRAWASYRHELEAKGESFDWGALAPPRVPDSQNFYSAPMMSTWFMRRSGETNTSKVLSDRLNFTNTCPKVLIAEVTFGAHAPAGQTNVLLRFNELASHNKAKELAQNIAGPSAFASSGKYCFTAQRVNASQVRPLHIYLEADKQPGIKELISFFGNNEDGPFLFQPSGTNSW